MEEGPCRMSWATWTGKITGGRITSGRIKGVRITGGRITGGRIPGGRITGGRITSGRPVARCWMGEGPYKMSWPPGQVG